MSYNFLKTKPHKKTDLKRIDSDSTPLDSELKAEMEKTKGKLITRDINFVEELLNKNILYSASRSPPPTGQDRAREVIKVNFADENFHKRMRAQLKLDKIFQVEDKEDKSDVGKIQKIAEIVYQVLPPKDYKGTDIVDLYKFGERLIQGGICRHWSLYNAYVLTAFALRQFNPSDD
jgi:hypothetical protein